MERWIQRAEQHSILCVVSVAAFAFSPIKDGLQKLGVGMGDSVQTSCVMHASWIAFSNSWKCLAARVFLERRRLPPQTSAGQMLHPEDRRSGASDVFLCAAVAQTWSHGAFFISQHCRNKNRSLMAEKWRRMSQTLLMTVVAVAAPRWGNWSGVTTWHVARQSRA